MGIRVVCDCGWKREVHEALAGRKFICQHCERQLSVPDQVEHKSSLSPPNAGAERIPNLLCPTSSPGDENRGISIPRSETPCEEAWRRQQIAQQVEQKHTWLMLLFGAAFAVAGAAVFGFIEPLMDSSERTEPLPRRKHWRSIVEEHLEENGLERARRERQRERAARESALQLDLGSPAGQGLVDQEDWLNPTLLSDEYQRTLELIDSRRRAHMGELPADKIDKLDDAFWDGVEDGFMEN